MSETASPNQIVAELTYQNFRRNVLQNPRTQWTQWKTVYGAQTDRYIERLKKEIANN